MSRITQIRCDAQNCAAVKQQTNHWFVLRRNDPTIFQAEMMDKAQEHSMDLHICGSTCLHGELERWIERHARLADEIAASPEE